MTIPLVPALLTGSSNLPGDLRRAVCSRTDAREASPYLVLLRAGFCLPRLLPAARCALTAPFHPYPPSRASRHEPARAGGRYIFCATSPSGCPARALPGALPCGVRTFLSRGTSSPRAAPKPTSRRRLHTAAIARPTATHHYRMRKGARTRGLRRVGTRSLRRVAGHAAFRLRCRTRSLPAALQDTQSAALRDTRLPAALRDTQLPAALRPFGGVAGHAAFRLRCGTRGRRPRCRTRSAPPRAARTSDRALPSRAGRSSPAIAGSCNAHDVRVSRNASRRRACPAARPAARRVSGSAAPAARPATRTKCACPATHGKAVRVPQREPKASVSGSAAPAARPAPRRRRASRTAPRRPAPRADAGPAPRRSRACPALTRQSPAKSDTARVSCRDCCAACRSPRPSSRCSSRCRAACSPERRARTST